MSKALVLGGTSGLGEIMSDLLLESGYDVVVKGSRDEYQKKGVAYHKLDQSKIDIHYTLEGIDNVFDIVIFNAGILHFDNENINLLNTMYHINYLSNSMLYKQLLLSGSIISTTKVIINSSIQALKLRIGSHKYAESKKELKNFMLVKSLHDGISKAVLGIDLVNNPSTMFASLRNTYIDKLFNGDVNAWENYLAFNGTPLIVAKDALKRIIFCDTFESDYGNKFVIINKDGITIE